MSIIITAGNNPAVTLGTCETLMVATGTGEYVIADEVMVKKGTADFVSVWKKSCYLPCTTFDVPGTYEWTVPSGIYEIDVCMVGGGGAGGFHDTDDLLFWAVGGGYAGTEVSVPGFAVTPGDIHTIVVGAGGPGIMCLGSSCTGNAGQPSSAFGYTAAGGAGGSPSDQSNNPDPDPIYYKGVGAAGPSGCGGGGYNDGFSFDATPGSEDTPTLEMFGGEASSFSDAGSGSIFVGVDGGMGSGGGGLSVIDSGNPYPSGAGGGGQLKMGDCHDTSSSVPVSQMTPNELAKAGIVIISTEPKNTLVDSGCKSEKNKMLRKLFRRR